MVRLTDDAHDLAVLVARLLRRPDTPRLPIDQSTQIALRLVAHDLRRDSTDEYDAEAVDVLETYASVAPATRNGQAAQWEQESETLRALMAKAQNPKARHDQPQTAHDAARAARPNADTVKGQLLELLLAAGRAGLTHREATDLLVDRFGRKQTTNRVSSRLNELALGGWAVRTEETRETSRTTFGRAAHGRVYAASVEAIRGGNQ